MTASADFDPLGIGGGASGGGLFGQGLPGSGSPNSGCSPFAWLPPWIPWGQMGGGGGSGSPGVQKLIEAAAGRITSDFTNKPDCANDFKNTNKDLAKLTHVGVGNLGIPTFTTAGGTTTVQGLDARYNYLTGNITLNSHINWSDPSNTLAITNGQPETYNALEAQATYLGVGSVSGAQFMDIMLLHELSHYNGTIGNPDNQAVETRIWNDCIK